MPLRTAYHLCPDAIFLPVDYEEYSRISRKFKAVLREITPIMEDVGIDEAFLDISSVERPSDEVAREVKRRIREETASAVPSALRRTGFSQRSSLIWRNPMV